MNKADQLYERAVACHQMAANSSKESEKKGWFELATIWLILADNASAKRTQFKSTDTPIELNIEDVVNSIAARPIISTARALVRFGAGPKERATDNG